jgi:hypothetical protein
MMEFWLSGSLSHELFLFSRWNSGYHEAFSRTLSFFMMEFWLLRSLFTNPFFFHDGISAITKPFHELLFFTMESWLLRSLFTNPFFFHDGILAITKPFHEFFFHVVESTKCTIWGKTLFIYITKSIYIGSASLKTLPLD